MRKRDKILSPDELARKELIKNYLKKLPSYDSLDLGALAREIMSKMLENALQLELEEQP